MNRRRKLVATVAIALGILGPGRQVVAKCEATGAKEKVVLEFDHAAGTWRNLPKDVDLSEEWPAVPTVFLGDGKQFEVWIVNTNPLLYAVTEVGVASEDSQLAGALQELLALLGGVLKEISTVAGSRAMSSPSVKKVPGLSDLKIFQGPRAQSDELPAFEDLRKAMEEVAKLLETLGNDRRKAIDLIQVAEFSFAKPTDALSAGPDLLSKLSTAFRELRAKKKVLDPEGLTCLAPSIRVLQQAVEQGANETDVAALRETADALRKIPFELAGGCLDNPMRRQVLDNAAALGAAVSDLAEALEDLANAKASLERLKSGNDKRAIAAAQLAVAVREKAGDGARSAIGAALRHGWTLDLIKAFVVHADAIGPILEKAETVLAREGEARKLAANLMAFSVRLEAAKNSDWKLEVPVVGVGDWEKIKTYSFEVKASSPYAAEIGRNPLLADRSLKCRAAWKGDSVLGVGVGLTHTKLEESTWAALPLEGDPETKVPQVKRAETRAGQLALFVNWKALQSFAPATRAWRVKPGLELGVGLDTDTKAAFLGLSFEIAKALRLGIGRTWQKVTVLNGQEEGVTVVASDDEIRTRQAFRSEWYASLTFALDSLRLFKRE